MPGPGSAMSRGPPDVTVAERIASFEENLTQLSAKLIQVNNQFGAHILIMQANEGLSILYS